MILNANDSFIGKMVLCSGKQGLQELKPGIILNTCAKTDYIEVFCFGEIFWVSIWFIWVLNKPPFLKDEIDAMWSSP